MKSVRTIVSAFFGVGLLLLAVAGFLTVRTASFLARASSAPGVVIELRETRDSDGGTLYRPVVRFAPRSGGDLTIESSMGTAPPAFSVGERVEVLYAPDNPRDARIRSFGSLWFGRRTRPVG